MGNVVLRPRVVGDAFGIGGVQLGFHVVKVLLDLDVNRVVLGLRCIEVGLDKVSTSVVVAMPSFTGDCWTLFSQGFLGLCMIRVGLGGVVIDL